MNHPGILEMQLSASRSRLDLAGSAAAALLAGVLFAPTPAQAGCGDYVHIAARTAAPAAERPAVPQPGPAPADSPIPCNGPHCSQGRLPPPAPPVATPALADQWAYATGEVVPPSDAAAAGRRDEPPARPRHQPRSIYHPPRPCGTSFSS